jgi:protein involved in polysaccharide export with SLBB domain
MKKVSVAAVLALVLMGWAATAQSPSSDQLNTLKNMPQDAQSQLLQSVLGTNGDTSQKKVDPSLKMPETVQQKSDQSMEDQYSQYIRDKTHDGRRLRLPNEDPELRADDTVLLDLRLIDRAKKDDKNNNSNGNNASGGSGMGNQPNNGINGATGVNGIAGVSGLSGLNGINGLGLPGTNGGTNGNGSANAERSAEEDQHESYGRDQPDAKPMTDEEKSTAEEFQERILRNNPYKLNRFGVLEIPGLPSIPLAGLTASEATRRLSADPDLRDFTVKLTLLRLEPFGEESLKPFGYDLFEGVPSTFAPVSDIQVPVDYVVGPGDTLEIQLYGNQPASYSLTVERDGRVNFPKLGPILVSGLTFEDARAAIEDRVTQQMIGGRVSVTMGNLRSIRVFVLGEANKPGSYTVSGLSTMTNALFVSGGVKKIGSLRKIELKRNGKLVTVLDLYDLLLHGDTSGDRQLMPGDVIFIPPIGETVSVSGAVRRPAIYELKEEKTADQVVTLAGGLMPDADGKLSQLERIQPMNQLEMRNIDLSASKGRDFPMANGDKLRIPAIRPILENSVELTGYVYRPGAFEYRPGLRLSDILTSFDELRPNADRRYIMIRRQLPPEFRVEVVSANLERALAARGTAADVELKPRDKIFVFDLSASRARIVAPVVRDLELEAGPDHPAQLVSIDGKIKAPGRYPLEPTMRVSDLIRAGGSLDDAAYLADAELTRYDVVDGQVRETQLIPVDLAAIRHGDAAADVRLRPYDILVIKPIPRWEEPGTIEVVGEVRFPGKYPIRYGETLSSVMRRAGGFTDLAFGEGAVFIREELKKREKDQLELLTNRMQSDLAALSLESVASSVVSANGSASNSAANSLVVGQQLMTQLRDTKPVGRLVIDVDKVVKGQPGGVNDIAVRDGDKLMVPKKTQEITILGEVQSPTSHVYQPGLSRDDYIARSGGVTQKADRKHIYIVRANGDVISGERHGWFRKSQLIVMRPGDTIVVPLDTERIRALPLWQAVTTIIYNLAVALLAVHAA